MDCSSSVGGSASRLPGWPLAVLNGSYLSESLYRAVVWPTPMRHVSSPKGRANYIIVKGVFIGKFSSGGSGFHHIG